MPRRAAFWPPPRPRSPKVCAAASTGIIAFAGSATPPSRCGPCWTVAMSRRVEPGATGCCAQRGAISRTFRSSTARPGSTGCLKRHWTGCLGTRRRPVHVGNAAVRQRQLDIYGETMNALHVAHRHGIEPNATERRLQCALIDRLESMWEQPDRGIWESREEPKQHTYSKVMAWVAMDRAVKEWDSSAWRGGRMAAARQLCVDRTAEPTPSVCFNCATILDLSRKNIIRRSAVCWATSLKRSPISPWSILPTSLSVSAPPVIVLDDRFTIH